MTSTRTKLVESRKKMGLTQEELAKRAKISRAYLSNIEAGKHTPSLQVARTLSAILETTMEELFL
jgi:putative transcriptional regulator